MLLTKRAWVFKASLSIVKFLLNVQHGFFQNFQIGFDSSFKNMRKYAFFWYSDSLILMSCSLKLLSYNLKMEEALETNQSIPLIMQMLKLNQRVIKITGLRSLSQLTGNTAERKGKISWSFVLPRSLQSCFM